MIKTLKEIDEYLKTSFKPALFRIGDNGILYHHMINIENMTLKTIDTEILDLNCEKNKNSLRNAIVNDRLPEFLLNFKEKIKNNCIKNGYEFKE